MIMAKEILEGFEVARLHEEAVNLLCKIGLKVPNEKIRQRLKKRLVINDDRAIFERDTIEEFVKEIRNQGSKSQSGKKIMIGPGRGCCYFVESETQEIKPFDTKKLIECTKLIASLSKEGVIVGGTPGYPLDVHPNLQFITQYYVDCCYNESPSSSFMVQTKEILMVLVEIAKVMGHKLYIGLEPVSPLTFGGNTVDIAFDFSNERIIRWYMDPMPMMGTTAPLDWQAGWVQSIAENLGTYVLLRILRVENLEPSFRLFLTNMASMMLSFGSPFYFISLVTRKKVREFYNLDTIGCESMYTLSTLPDSQAAIEKSIQTILAVSLGYWCCEGAGVLGGDEVFSPQQLIIDIEIRNYLESTLKEFKTHNKENNLLGLIEEGLERGFLSTETTLNIWKDFSWSSLLFNQGSRASWEKDKKKILDSAGGVAKERIQGYDYELTGGKRKEIDEIILKVKALLIR